MILFDLGKFTLESDFQTQESLPMNLSECLQGSTFAINDDLERFMI